METIINTIGAIRDQLNKARLSEDERWSLEQELSYLQEDYTTECIAIGEHFCMTIAEGGYDVCFNCGGKS